MSGTREFPEAPLHHVNRANSGSSSNSIQDDWNVLSFDSVERNRSRRQMTAAKRAQSFTLAYESPGQNFDRRPSASSVLRHKSNTLNHLYVKAMNYPQGLPSYPRQLYQHPADQARILSPRNDYSTGQPRVMSWQDASQQGCAFNEINRTLDNNQSPIKLSYSNLSQDSAYHSRHNSSVDMGGDPGAAGLYSFPGTKMHVHGRFPSWPEPDTLQTHRASTECITHTDEVLSQQAAKRIFQEAAARNAHSMKLNNRPPVVTPSRNYPNFQHDVGNPNDADRLRYDAAPIQPQRTKSFNGRAELTGVPSMTQFSGTSSVHYKSSNDISQPGVSGYKIGGNNGGAVMTCRPFYNTSTQTDPSQREAASGARSPRDGREWSEGGIVRRSVQFLSKSEGGGALDGEWMTAEPPVEDFGFTDRFLTTVQKPGPSEMGCGLDDRLNRSVGSVRQPDAEVVGQAKGYPSNQLSMIRQLSKEFYGQAGKRGIGLNNRMIISGDRQQRLGSIDENNQSNEGPGYESREDLKTRRKSSDGDRGSKGVPSGLDRGDVVWRGSSLPPGVLGVCDNRFSDDNENLGYVTKVTDDLGNGSGFVRNRKSQMSLRKAFGIFDEFEIMESSPRNVVPRQTSKSTRSAGDTEQPRDFEALRGSKSSLAPSDALWGHNPQSDDHLRQRSSDDRVLHRSSEDHDRVLLRSPEDRVLHHSPEAHVSPRSSHNPHLQRHFPDEISFRSNANDQLSYRDPQQLLPEGSPETGWQRSPVDTGVSYGTSFPESDVSMAIARRKSECLPLQQTPLQLADNAARRFSSHDPSVGVLYTGTGVLSVNLLPRSENLQHPSEVHGATDDGRELDRTKPSTSPSSSSIVYRSSPSSSARTMSPTPMFSSSSPSHSGPRDARSPAPPELPPRQYLKPDIAGEENKVAVKGGVELFSANDSDVDSTLKRDTYAQQLRQESRRLSHSSSHALRRQPTLPKASPGGEDFNHQMDGQYEDEAGVVPLSDRPTHSYSVSNHLPQDGNIGESFEVDRTTESANVRHPSSSHGFNSSSNRVKALTAKFSSGSASEKSYVSHQNKHNIDTRLSTSPVMSTGPTFRSSNRFQEESVERANIVNDHNLRSSVEATFHPAATPYSISMETSDARNRTGGISPTFSGAQNPFDGAEEAGTRPKHRQKVGIHKATKNKEKIDTAIVLPNVRSVESASEKNATPLPVTGKVEKAVRTSPGKVAKVKCLQRQWKSTEEESAYECPVSVDIHQLPDAEQHPPETAAHIHPMTSSSVRRSRHKQKQLSKGASTYDDPAAVIAQRLPDDERKPLPVESTTSPSPVAILQIPKDKKRRIRSKEPLYDQTTSDVIRDDETNIPSAHSQPTAAVVVQHPPPESSESHPSEAPSASDRPIPAVILRHPKDERRSSGRFSSSPQHKTAADYMTGLFTEEDGDSTVQSDTLTRNSVQRASLRSRLLVARQAKENKERVSSTILPEEGPCLSNELCEMPLDLKCSEDEVKATSEEEKLELMHVLERKVDILREERQLLHEEITENKILGRQVSAIVEQRLEAKELSKYRSYVDELEKVLYLVLKLSDRLAKAENGILALPQNASDKEKAALVSKRNDLIEKHGDALSLKEGIDRRRHQVAGYLQKCLSEAELKDYEYFVKMKAQLVIDQQEVEDKIEMGQRQLDLLRSTLNSDFESTTSSGYFGPKSYC